MCSSPTHGAHRPPLTGLGCAHWIGKMIELVAGKAGLCHGKVHDGSAFAGDSIEEVSAALIKSGYNYRGKDYITSGITGEGLSAYIFFGPIFYQKLKHMVIPACHHPFVPCVMAMKARIGRLSRSKTRCTRGHGAPGRC